MKKNVNLRIVSAATLLLSMSMHYALFSQSQITVYGAAGTSDVEINGLGFLDIVDPYIKPIAQYTVGIRYEHALSSHFALMTGAQYTSRGFGAREEFNIPVFGLDLPVGASLETRLNYMEVPVMIKYNVTETGIQPYVKAGLSAGYALDGKITPKVNALISWKLPSMEINLDNDMYNRFDVSALAGAGVSIPIHSTGSFHIEASYRHSLNDMFLDNITDIRIKSHGLSAGIGYSIRF